MDAFQRGYETEEIFHEEDPLRVLKRLEAEGWMKHLFPALSSAKANVAELERLRESQMQLQMQGIHPETSAANFPLLTAKMAPKDVAALKKSFARQGFVQEIEALEGEAQGVCDGVFGQRRGDAIAGMEDAALGQAGGGAMGGAHLEERGDSGEVQGLLYRMAAGEAEDSVRHDAGDAHCSGAAGVRRTAGQAVLRVDGRTS